MPEQTVDNAPGSATAEASSVATDVAALASAAESALEPIVASKLDLFAQRGHEIITTELARAKTLAATYPVIGVLMPAIESTLRSLFAHIVAGADAPAPVLPESRVESAAPVLQRRPAEVASDAQPSDGVDVDPAAQASASDPTFPPVRDDKVPAPETPVG